MDLHLLISYVMHGIGSRNYLAKFRKFPISYYHFWFYPYSSGLFHRQWQSFDYVVVPSALLYKTHLIPKLKCFLPGLGIALSQTLKPSVKSRMQMHPYISGLFQVQWNGAMFPELGDLPRQIWVKCSPCCLSVCTIGNTVLLVTPSTCTTNLVLYVWVKSLQFLCLSRIRWLHLRVPDLQKSCNKWHQATCPFEILSSMSTDMFKDFLNSGEI